MVILSEVVSVGAVVGALFQDESKQVLRQLCEFLASGQESHGSGILADGVSGSEMDLAKSLLELPASNELREQRHVMECGLMTAGRSGQRAPGRGREMYTTNDRGGRLLSFRHAVQLNSGPTEAFSGRPRVENKGQLVGAVAHREA